MVPPLPGMNPLELPPDLAAFDRPIERRDTSSVKWNRYGDRDILPLWVADMDFSSPPAVLSALHDRVNHGVFGYTEPPDSLVEAFIAHALAQYGWPIQADWLVWLPGLVAGLNLACSAVGRPRDAVITAAPVYPPFLSAPTRSGRERITVPLRQQGHSWGWDIDALESAITPHVRLLLLCHPHNPVGRAWRDEELQALIDLARRHDWVICSDEIHCDLLLEPDARHRPLACIAPYFAERTITLMAPSKTWNLAGLGCAVAVIPDAALRRRFQRAMAGLVPSPNLLGYVAAEAAYRHGEPWRRDLIEYLGHNRRLLADWLQGSERLACSLPEATYLAWIDARAIDAENPLPAFEELGVGLSDGRDFGAPGFVRLNFGCRRAVLEEALRRMRPLW